MEEKKTTTYSHVWNKVLKMTFEQKKMKNLWNENDNILTTTKKSINNQIFVQIGEFKISPLIRIVFSLIVIYI